MTQIEALKKIAAGLGTANPVIGSTSYIFSLPYKPGDRGSSGFEIGKVYLVDILGEVNDISDEELPRALATCDDSTKRILLEARMKKE